MPEIWFKFYPRDWAADAQLNRCTLAAREVWKRMTFLMREAEPYGFFVGRSGEPIDIAWFSREVNATLREVKKCMEQLELEGVYSRDSFGRIYSRRMVREKARQEQLRENGAQGGNPALLDKQGLDNQNKTKLDNQSDDSLDKHRLDMLASRAHKPEARIPDTDSLRSSAMATKVWPMEVAGLREMALLFIAAFANTRDPLKAEKYLPYYTQVLAQIRSRRFSIAEAWQACSDAREANNGKPLFAAAIKSAMSFLPAKSTTGLSPVPAREVRGYLHGEKCAAVKGQEPNGWMDVPPRGKRMADLWPEHRNYGIDFEPGAA